MRNYHKYGKADLPTLIVFISLFFVLFVYNNFLSTIDCWLQDFWFQTRITFNNVAPDNNLVKKLFPLKDFNKDIVLIIVRDDDLLSIQGLYDNHPDYYAKAIDNLKELGAKVIGIDVFFEKENTNFAYYRNLINSLSKYKDNKVILRSLKRDEQHNTPFDRNLRNYADMGFIFYKNFKDKTKRAILLKQDTEDTTYYSFQLLLWAKYNGINLNDIELKDNYLKINDENKFKLIDSKYFLLNYNRNLYKSFFTYSFKSLLENKIPENIIKDKIIIISSSHSRTTEKYYTPVYGYLNPPLLHALSTSNLIENNFLIPNNIVVTNIIIAILLIICFFVYSYISLTLSLVVAFILTLILLIISLTGLMQYNTQINVVAPILAVILSYLFILGKKYYKEYSEKRHIKSAFQHYVTASVVNEILKDPSKLNLHGEERNLTIFFSDIEGFTSLAEGMSPLDVVSLLNEYLTAMTDIIFEFNGLLDKYEGDAIMAVFGAPVDQSDHATRACRCALKNQKVLNQLRTKWKTEGKPEMKVRIGINTGVVVVGNMGSTMRFDYTVIGDNVNLAARLEAANKIFNSSILISEETAKLAEKSVVSRKLAVLKAVGKSINTTVYEVLADKESDSASEIEKAIKAKEVYEKADNSINERNFDDAEKILDVYLKENEDDLPAKLLYNKVKGYLLVPPPADWQNVIIQEK